MTKIEKIVSKEKARLGVPKWIRFRLTNPSWKDFTLKGWDDYVLTIYNMLVLCDEFEFVKKDPPLWNGTNIFKRDKIEFTIYPRSHNYPFIHVPRFINELDKAYGFKQRHFSIDGFNFFRTIVNLADEQKLFVSQSVKNYYKAYIDQMNDWFDEGMAGKEYIKDHGRNTKWHKRTEDFRC